MPRALLVALALTFAGCSTSMLRVPVAAKQYPLQVCVKCENEEFSRRLAGVLSESGLVLAARNPGSEDGEFVSADGIEIELSIENLAVEKSWQRNTWCYVTTIPGIPVAFVFSSIILAPIFGPYGGYAWFPPNVTPVVTVEISVTADLSLGPVASTSITETASTMCSLDRSWVQMGRLDDKWFSTVLGGNWDRNYSTEKLEWSAFFDPQEYDWSRVEEIAFHNVACRVVTWLEETFRKLEEGW
jgi:hypothetical protein